MIASSISLPATRTGSLETVPASEMTAMSVVPPPMSTIMFPAGSVIGMPAPVAGAHASPPTRPSAQRARCGAPHAAAAGRRHRFLDQMHFARLRAIGTVLDGALLDLRDLGRHPDDN